MIFQYPVLGVRHACDAQLQPMPSTLPLDAAVTSATQRLHGLPPVADARTRLVVLGSFPGVASLQVRQYYGHPRNQLWTILQGLWPQYAMPSCEDYAGRCAWLLARGLGLWDVYASCERQGSLDSAIRLPQLNDFVALQRRCPQLVAVAHNGGESAKHARTLHGLGLQVHQLPSTSPANASWNLERKRQAWKQVMAEYGLLDKD